MPLLCLWCFVVFKSQQRGRERRVVNCCFWLEQSAHFTSKNALSRETSKDLIASPSRVSTKVVFNCTTKGDKNVFHFPYCKISRSRVLYCFGNGINLSLTGSFLHRQMHNFSRFIDFALLFQYVHPGINRNGRHTITLDVFASAISAKLKTIFLISACKFRKNLDDIFFVVSRLLIKVSFGHTASDTKTRTQSRIKGVKIR